MNYSPKSINDLPVELLAVIFAYDFAAWRGALRAFKQTADKYVSNYAKNKFKKVITTDVKILYKSIQFKGKGINPYRTYFYHDEFLHSKDSNRSHPTGIVSLQKSIKKVGYIFYENIPCRIYITIECLLTFNTIINLVRIQILM
jgi:hypothetical protein